ncbi:MAG: hypothetical protein OEM82_03595 [Acidobacteriota bacterium]|nr:hypothetical protein [Acidobacteriota bacterium]MDH3527939.1 hypothetical protein [Acidobacteriota bacterium]
MRTRPVRFVVIATLVLCCTRIFAQSPEPAQFRLAGTHSFEVKDATSWTVDREEIDEKSGKSNVVKNVAFASGEKSEFQLTKSKNKTTIYRLVARGKSFSRTFRVTVLEADRVSTFFYQSEGNPAVRTYILVPASLHRDSRILFVMHGLGRNADEYIASWEKWGRENQHVIVCPEFDNENWKGSGSYNLGNVFAGNSGWKKVNARSKWSYQIVEDIYMTVKNELDLRGDDFDIFGHSAGAQFVHRFAIFMPNSKFRIAIAANAGWYTLPDLNAEFPYGFKHPKLAFTQNDLIAWSRRNVLLLRGTEDTERTPNLRQTPEADVQGKTRYERAGFMIERMRSINPDTNWRMIDVPGVGHEQELMAIAAQNALDLINSDRN